MRQATTQVKSTSEYISWYDISISYLNTVTSPFTLFLQYLPERYVMVK